MVSDHVRQLFLPISGHPGILVPSPILFIAAAKINGMRVSITLKVFRGVSSRRQINRNSNSYSTRSCYVFLQAWVNMLT